MPIYGKIGENVQYMMSEAQARKHGGLVLMNTERPSVEYIAQEDGTWEQGIPPKDIPLLEVDEFYERYPNIALAVFEYMEL